MNSSHGYWQAKFILGANFAHKATESQWRWQLSLARKENPWHESLRCWQTVFAGLASGVCGVLATEAVKWIKARVCGLQAGVDGQATTGGVA